MRVWQGHSIYSTPELLKGRNLIQSLKCFQTIAFVNMTLPGVFSTQKAHLT